MRAEVRLVSIMKKDDMSVSSTEAMDMGMAEDAKQRLGEDTSLARLILTACPHIYGE